MVMVIHNLQSLQMTSWNRSELCTAGEAKKPKASHSTSLRL